jgi:hypothetical protein
MKKAPHESPPSFTTSRPGQTSKIPARSPTSYALVFHTLTARGVPVAWNLAGGYQRRPDGSIPDVLAIHANTAREARRALRAVREAR